MFGDKEKECECCGKKYIPTGGRSKYCGKECRNYIKNHTRKMPKARKRSKQAQVLIDYAAEAKKAGLSYGEYVARLEFGKR